MDKYIGIDAHESSCAVVVIGPNGRKRSEEVVETDRTAHVECIRSIPKPRHLCLEEGTLSSWLYELLNPHVDELVVAGTTEKCKGTKDDRHAALALAQDLRSRFVHRRWNSRITWPTAQRSSALPLTSDVSDPASDATAPLQQRGILAVMLSNPNSSCPSAPSFIRVRRTATVASNHDQGRDATRGAQHGKHMQRVFSSRLGTGSLGKG